MDKPSQSLPLNGKTALVTGSAKRVGAAIVRELHRLGAHVVIHYRGSADAALALKTELNGHRPDSASVAQADLLDPESYGPLIDAATRHSGALDILVNNASTYYSTSMADASQQDWNDLMGSNARAPFFLSQAAAPRLKATQGCIINIVDVHAFRPNLGFPIYSMAKAANAQMVKSLARELAPDVRVNGVAPGAILWPEQADGSYEEAEILERIPLGRAGTPQDIAEAVAFLAQSNYITGQILPVCGGRTVQQ
ncbi:MAG: pteridine reductase [bacterium]